MDGFSRILEKKLSELLCTRLYVLSSYLLKFAVHAAKEGKQKVRPLKWLLSVLFQTFLLSSSRDMQPPGKTVNTVFCLCFFQYVSIFVKLLP